MRRLAYIMIYASSWIASTNLYADAFAPISSDQIRINRLRTIKSRKFEPKRKRVYSEDELRAKTLRTKKKQIPRRRLASVNSSSAFSSAEYDLPRSEKEMELRLGASGGISNASFSAHGQGQVGSSMHLGLNADLRWENFGFELDGFFQNYPTQTDTELTSVPGGSFTNETSGKVVGGSFSAKGQLPFEFASMRMVAKAGVGYSILGMTSVTTDSGSQNSLSFGVRGIHGIAGIEITPFEDFLISADIIYGVINSATGDAGGNGPAFSRIRLGAYYRLFEKVSLGVQYNRDDFSVSDFLGNANSQFLGALLVHF